MSLAVARHSLALPFLLFACALFAAEPVGKVVPAGTVVNFEIVDHLNSKLSKIGDHFAIKLVEPIVLNGEVIVPAGTVGQGEVIHAARARAAGKAGELIIAARYLDYAQQKIDLRAFRFGKSGDSNVTDGFAVALAVSPFLAYLVVGGELDVPPGTRGNAKLKSDFVAVVEPVAQNK